MKPALSIVLFTVSSGAGLGLLALIALADLFAQGTLTAQVEWRGALLGLVLVALGLASSVLHLANPKNAWRSFARFRTSWLSREAVFAAALFPVAAIFIGLLVARTIGGWRGFFSLATCLLAWAVLFSTAMIYASLKPIRQWRTPWTPVNYLLLGHWSGALLLGATVSAYGTPARSLFVLALVLGVAALAAKLVYWYSMSERPAGTKNAPTLERAIGVEQGVHGPGMTVARARLLDVGHSHGTFLTEEFGFVLARRHATLLRGAALALGFGLPLIWLLTGPARWQLGLAAAACGIIGLLAERWLFFAEARHTVRLYHGDPRT
ncbi:MAG TPA: DmsC/YnfH family molybdoenzyme membrane anchor subunit [Casimicrobiaceae bacterium]|nr:DmsC/YnfH family molybdoenzyme membrane anchor subunit [Casimicrobiaceae bacterium]